MPMTTTAMIKTKAAVMDPTMRGSCSCHDFGGSAIGVKQKTLLSFFITSEKSEANRYKYIIKITKLSSDLFHRD